MDTSRTQAGPTITRRHALELLVGGAAAATLASCASVPNLSGTEAAEPADESQDGQEAQAVAPGLEHPMLLASLASVDAPAATAEYETEGYTLDAVTNLDDWYLSDQMRDLLGQNLFCVTRGGGDEFFDLYESNRYDLRPSFVTVDSMMHTYHLYFAHLLKLTERTSLMHALDRMGELLLDASVAQAESAAGTDWEDAAWRNVAFFAVPASLAGHWATIPDHVAELVDAECERITAAEGISTSGVTGADLDYSQFTPRGYYEGDRALETYFREMMWYGQLNFTQTDESLDRSAALMTCALEGEALTFWEAIYAVTSFFAGASDDNGYYEYKPILDEAFGADATIDELLASEDGFARFHELTAQAAAPRINSLPTIDDGDQDDELEEGRGFRLMGQRFSIDAAIMQRLIYSCVGENPAGDKRMLPDALDVPAALGSDQARQIVRDRGADEYARYTEHMDGLRAALQEAPEGFWSASLYSQWLHTLAPLLEEKGEGYPPFMRSANWGLKSLQSYLGSYTELKHDTVLYAKQVMAEMGGGPEEERDDRGYVEPEPVIFGRLAELTRATAEGLDGYGMLTEQDADNLELLSQLAGQLATIATKELAGEMPDDDEYELIRSFGGQLEHFWQEVYKDDAEDEWFTSREFPAAVVTDIATDPNGSCLELGTGKVASLYVVAPVGDELRLMRGGVYTFYQFTQPLSDRMTDSEWRDLIAWSYGDTIGDSITAEDWSAGFTAGTDE